MWLAHKSEVQVQVTVFSHTSGGWYPSTPANRGVLQLSDSRGPKLPGFPSAHPTEQYEVAGAVTPLLTFANKGLLD